jgi:hypothetical protein
MAAKKSKSETAAAAAPEAGQKTAANSKVPDVQVGHQVLYKGQNSDGETITRPAVVIRHLGLGVCDLNVHMAPGDGAGAAVAHKKQVGFGNGDHTWKPGPAPLCKDDSEATAEGDDGQVNGE